MGVTHGTGCINEPLGPGGAERCDPFGVGKRDWTASVGGGHTNRALAHGYSILTPSGSPGRLKGRKAGIVLKQPDKQKLAKLAGC